MTEDRIKLSDALLKAMSAANKLSTMHPYKYHIIERLSDLLDKARAEVK